MRETSVLRRRLARTMYALIYRADGTTYHPMPNRGEWFTQGENCRSTFGHDAMRQVLVFQKA